MVVSSVPSAPLPPPWTRLPGSMRRSEMRPVIGARICVKPTSSARDWTRALAAASAALVGLNPRTQSVDIAARDRIDGKQPRRAAVIGLRQREIAARARHRGARFGQSGDERARVDREEQLALVDDAPSVKCTPTMAPDTRGRTSTLLLASKRPE